MDTEIMAEKEVRPGRLMSVERTENQLGRPTPAKRLDWSFFPNRQACVAPINTTGCYNVRMKGTRCLRLAGLRSQIVGIADDERGSDQDDQPRCEAEVRPAAGALPFVQRNAPE